MQLDVFLSVINTDNELRSQGEKVIFEAMTDPAFVFFMLNGTQSEQCKSNPTLFKLVASGCVNMIRNHWVSDVPFWSDAQKAEITRLLLEIIFRSEPELRPFLVEAFHVILIGSFPGFAVDVVGKLVEALTKSLGNVNDMVSVLQILVFWAQACESCVIPEEAVEQIERLNAAVTQILVGIAGMDHGARSFEIVELVAQLIRGFTRKLNAAFACAGFHTVLEFCVKALTVPTEGDVVRKCKTEVLELFVVLCRELLSIGDGDGVREKFGCAFRTSIGPQVLSVVVAAVPIEKDQHVLAYLLYLLYLFCFHKVGNFDFLNQEFITNVLIPLAKLTPEDIEESTINPLQFLCFNFSYDCSDDVITTRTTLASILGVLVKDESLLDPLYDFLLKPTRDRIEFESRIFLMTKYIKATLTNLGPMIEPSVVEAIGGKLKEKQIMTPWVATSILMFLSATLPYMDPELGCKWAAECITENTSEIVLCAASDLLRTSIVECDAAVVLPVHVIIPKLLQLASVVAFPGLTTAIEAVIQISGPEIYPYLIDTMKELFNLCHASLSESSSQSCSHILYSMFEIVNAIPDDAPILAELTELCLPHCVELFTRYPENNAFDDIFLFISAFNSKIDNVTDTMYDCLNRVLDIVAADVEALMNSMQNIAFMMCPIILSPGFPAHAHLVGKCFEITTKLMQCTTDLGDVDLHAYTIMIAGTLILVTGNQGFPFMEPVCHAIVSVKDNTGVILFSACVYAITCSLLAENTKLEETFAALPGEVIQLLIAKISGATLQTYKELRMGFIALLLFTQCGNKDAYITAVNCLESLYEKKLENDLPPQQKMAQAIDRETGAAEFPPLVIPFALRRIDTIDPFAMFADITKRFNLLSTLPPDRQQFVREWMS